MLRQTTLKILVVFFLVSLAAAFRLSAQERVDSRQEARQHYEQGKVLYSQGRYQEATTEFERAIVLITPSEIEFSERVQAGVAGDLAASSAGLSAGTSGVKRVAPLIIPEEIEFEEKVQKREEKTLRPAAPKTPSSAKKAPGQKTEVRPGAEKPAPEAKEREYYIDIGDVLDISVWRIPDLSRPEVIVRPDGKISFPLIGDIGAEGLTLTRLDDIITEKLKTYVKEPEVSLMIRRFGEQANKVVVLGEIFGPGVYRFSGPPTITEVIASAGGYTKYAVLNSIMVISGDVRTKPDVTRVNLAKIIKGGRISENIFLRPNDIIYVPKSFIGNFNTFLEIFQPAISEYMQYMNARHFHNIMRKKGGA